MYEHVSVLLIQRAISVLLIQRTVSALLIHIIASTINCITDTVFSNTLNLAPKDIHDPEDICAPNLVRDWF